MNTCAVELAGPAGAGKTTLAATLVAQGSGTLLGVDVRRLRTCLGLVRVAPVLLWGRVATRGRQWTKDELRSIAYLSAWRAPVAHGPGHGLVLLDHGPVFRLAMLAAVGPPMARGPVFLRWWRRTAVEWGRLLDGVVFLDAADAVLGERIDSRHRYHRVQSARRDEVETFLARYRESYARVLDLVAGTGTLVLRVDTSASTPEEIARVVTARLGRTDTRAVR
jgi:shikimate kinase